jgi:transcriptional regulator with XRE-family HTH domain
MPETFGDWVKEARKRTTLTQKELGDRLGLSRVQMWRIESNEQGTKPPTVRAIAELTGADLERGMELHFLQSSPGSEPLAVTREPDPDRQFILEAYEGADAPQRRLLLNLAALIRQVERDTTIAGGHVADDGGENNEDDAQNASRRARRR